MRHKILLLRTSHKVIINNDIIIDCPTTILAFIRSNYTCHTHYYRYDKEPVPRLRAKQQWDNLTMIFNNIEDNCSIEEVYIEGDFGFQYLKFKYSHEKWLCSLAKLSNLKRCIVEKFKQSYGRRGMASG